MFFYHFNSFFQCAPFRFYSLIKIVDALFYEPNGSSYKVDAFFYEDYSFQKVNGHEFATPHFYNNGWRIRFTPPYTGTWQFKIMAHDYTGATAQMPSDTTAYYSFTCNSVQNAEGFISLANSRFLKRDVVNAGVRQYHSFFPIGPNVAWYDCNDYGTYEEPFGIYEYENRIDSMTGKANYLRVWLSRYQAISLYGPEYTQTNLSGNHVVYFNNTINQKDSAELDHIINYAKQQGVSIMPCVFCFGDFRTSNSQEPGDPSIWANNPFNTLLGLENPCQFFTDDEAKTITKNLLRYIVSRWGYATNIVSWELWNEVELLFHMCDGNKHIEQDVLAWHEEMWDYLLSIDTHKHCVSTSMAGVNTYPYLYSLLYEHLDFVQIHKYEDIQIAESRYQVPQRLLNRVNNCHTQYPVKPCFVGEFGFGQGYSTHVAKDPYGVNLHNSLWASVFSSSMGTASFWWWHYLNYCGLYKHFAPLLTFCQNLPIPSNTFTGQHTGSIVGHQLYCENGLQTYYMANASQDTIYGWSQDTAFVYSSLRWLTDSVYVDSTSWGPQLRFKDNAVFDPLGYVYTMNPAKRPCPSSNSNMIKLPITNQPAGTNYLVKWYDSETGTLLNLGATIYEVVKQDSLGNKSLSFAFPSLIRDVKHQTINNRFGDAVFVLVRAEQPLYLKPDN